MNLLARCRLFAVLIVSGALLLSLAFMQAHRSMVLAQDALEEVDRVLAEVTRLRTFAFAFLLNRDPQSRTQTEIRLSRLEGMLTADWLAVTLSAQPQEELRLRAQVRDALGECSAVFMQLREAQDLPGFEERDRYNRDLFVLKSQELATAITALMPILRHAVARTQSRVEAAAFGMVGVLLGSALLATILIERYILKPLDHLRRAAIAIRKGDTTVHLQLARHDEIGKLSLALDQTLKQLAAANQELESFAYSVSHDLRAPLRAIDGFSRKVVEQFGDLLGDEGRRQLQVVRDSAQRMGRLIDDLLAFSRMGRREIELQPVDMDAMARAMACELLAAQGQGRIQLDIGPLPAACGDPSMLRQVWFNLIDNALKFSCRKPDARLEIGGRCEPHEVLYWVKDNGAGFDMQYAGKLFGVFQRLHRQDEFEGTGVGLAIAQRILHRHSGRIWAEGEPQVGATFWFALPPARSSQAQTMPLLSDATANW